MATLVDDSAETVVSICAEAFDLIGFERLRPDHLSPPGSLSAP
jgi:hypothetical protein